MTLKLVRSKCLKVNAMDFPLTSVSVKKWCYFKYSGFKKSSWSTGMGFSTTGSNIYINITTCGRKTHTRWSWRLLEPTVFKVTSLFDWDWSEGEIHSIHLKALGPDQLQCHESGSVFGHWLLVSLAVNTLSWLDPSHVTSYTLALRSLMGQGSKGAFIKHQILMD